MATNYNVWAWSNSAALDNATADAEINWVEGQDPATVNNSARAMMMAIKKYADVTGGNLGSGGVVNAYIITTGLSISAGHQAFGFRICFGATTTNTGPSTIAVDGLSPVAILRPNGDALSAGDIVAGAFHDIVFDGTNYRLLSSPAAAAAAGGSLTGNNNWTGNNAFSGDTAIGEPSDWVAIKGTVVSSFVASLLSNSSGAAFRTAISLGTTNNPAFNSVTATDFVSTNEYRLGGVNVASNPTFLISMLGTLTQVAFGPGWAPIQAGARIPYRTPGGFWGYWLCT